VSLRYFLSTLMGAIGVLALIVCTCLVVLTTRMHDSASELARAHTSVHTAYDVELALLRHWDAKTPVARSSEAALLRVRLAEAGGYIDTPEEGQLVGELQRLVGAYLASSTGGAPSQTSFEAALADAEHLASLNHEYAEKAQARVARDDQLANILGTLVGALLACAIILLLAWLRREVFSPLIDLSESMQRFTDGDPNARAEEWGAAEVQTMARAFNETASSLVRSRRRQLRYLTGIIHDLRNPLAAVQLSLGFISPNRPLPPERRIRELFDLIHRQLDRVNSMIGDVLAAAETEAGGITLQYSQLDARELVTECAHLFSTMAPAYAIHAEMPDHPVELRCDPVRLEQVLNNLVSNAIKFSPAGSEVRIELAEEADAVRFTVVDHGPGIAPEDRERIFEAFQRTNAQYEEARGVGLGLYVSRRIAETHGGRIDLESRLGEGSSFSVWIPQHAQGSRLTHESERA
jgi:signal transduction histidine kinase